MSIKIVLAGRNYPLTINEGEEEVVREAVNGINNSIKRLQENYAVKDMQDLLAMTALKLATRPQKNSGAAENQDQGKVDEEKVVAALKELSRSLDQ